MLTHSEQAVPLLEARRIVQSFRQRDGSTVTAVNDVSLAIGPGEAVALVGESGSGKSSLARVLLCLSRPDSGQVCFNGERVDQLSVAQMRPHRRVIQPVFQDSSAAFNPRRTVKQILAQAVALATQASADIPESRLIDLLDQVQLRPAQALLQRFPHELSGGQRQRLNIARALAMQPRVIVADEPLSGADISIRGQILNLLGDLQRSHGVSYLFITHDMAIAREFADRVMVMYRGRVIEEGPARAVFESPREDYTRALVHATAIGHLTSVLADAGRPALRRLPTHLPGD